MKLFFLIKKSVANREKVVTDFPCENVKCLTTKYVPNEVRERYIISKYLIDPKKFRFRIEIDSFYDVTIAVQLHRQYLIQIYEK